MIETEVRFQIRRLKEPDHALVYQTWLRTYRNGGNLRGMPESVYLLTHHALIESILARGLGLVAHPAGDADTILGWLLRESPPRNVIHYLFVKGDLRRAGLGRALLSAAALEHGPAYTHKTRLGDTLLHLLPGAIYNPHLT